jgi:hypothetical protein
MLKRLTVTTLFLTVLSMAAAAQDAKTILGNASKAMGAENLNAITYSGSASNVISDKPKDSVGRTCSPPPSRTTPGRSLTQPASLATGTTMTPAAPGAPPAQPENFTQNITPANAGWTQQLEIWTTPGVLEGRGREQRTPRSTADSRPTRWRARPRPCRARWARTARVPALAHRLAGLRERLDLGFLPVRAGLRGLP